MGLPGLRVRGEVAASGVLRLVGSAIVALARPAVAALSTGSGGGGGPAGGQAAAGGDRGGGVLPGGLVAGAGLGARSQGVAGLADGDSVLVAVGGDSSKAGFPRGVVSGRGGRGAEGAGPCGPGGGGDLGECGDACCDDLAEIAEVAGDAGAEGGRGAGGDDEPRWRGGRGAGIAAGRPAQVRGDAGGELLDELLVGQWAFLRVVTGGGAGQQPGRVVAGLLAGQEGAAELGVPGGLGERVGAVVAVVLAEELLVGRPDGDLQGVLEPGRELGEGSGGGEGVADCLGGGLAACLAGEDRGQDLQCGVHPGVGAGPVKVVVGVGAGQFVG